MESILIEMIKVPKFVGKKPTKTKKIPRQYSAFRGKIHTTKLHLRYKRPRPVYPYVGQVERDLYYCLDHDLSCTEIIPQPCISIMDDNGEQREYTPDCWCSFFLGSEWMVFIYEAKPKSLKEKLDKTDENWKRRNRLLKKYCAEINKFNKKSNQNIQWNYEIVTEENFNTIRYQNIREISSKVLINISRPHIKQGQTILLDIYKRKDFYTFFDLKKQFKRELKKEDQSFNDVLIERIIYFFIYYQFLWIEWDEPFSKSNTFITENFDHYLKAVPFFEIKPIEIVEESFYPKQIKTEINLADISEKDEYIANDRRLIILPFYNQKENKRKRVSDSFIKEYKYPEETLKGIKNDKIKNASVRSIRRWLKDYEESRGNWKSLLPENYKKGSKRKSKFSSLIEQLIQDVLEDKENRLKKPVPIYEIIKKRCQEAGFDPPSEKTIRRRIKDQKARIRRGKQGGVMRDEIPSSVTSELPRGEYPLDIIQVDETLLNIFLVDELDPKERVKRPHLLAGIDSKTRMISSWHLGFDHADSVAVNRFLMRGFLPKNGLLKKFKKDIPYPIHGIPRMISFDHAKYFDTEYVQTFCFKHGVEETQFRPVKSPQKGGFIERFFKTIKGMISGETLAGWIPKEDIIGYNPRKDAALTLHQFEEWLLNKILIYHNKPHSGLKKDTGRKISPLSMYYEEMEGQVPRLPERPDLLEIEVFKHETRKLGKNGVLIFNSAYNNDGDEDFLLDIRKRKRGKTKRVTVYWDPEDIGTIHVYDPVKATYCEVGVSTGVLALFKERFPEIPIRYRDYVKFNKLLNQEKTPRSLQANEMCRRLEEENAQLINQSIKDKKKRKRIQKESLKTKIEFTDESPTLKDQISSSKEISYTGSKFQPHKSSKEDPYEKVKVYVNEILKPTEEDDSLYQRFKLDLKPTEEDSTDNSRVTIGDLSNNKQKLKKKNKEQR